MAFGRRGSVLGAVWRLAGVAAVAIAAIVGATHWSLAEVRRAEAEVQRVGHIQAELRDLSVAMLMAESGQRGFLLTRDEPYLAPYRRGVAESRRLLDILDRRIIHPEARALFARMRPAAEAKLAEIAGIVALAQAGRFDAAQAQMETDRGLALMQAFASLDLEIAELEARLQERRRDEFVAGLERLAWFVSAGGAVALGILVLQGWLTTQQLRAPLRALLDALDGTGRGVTGLRVGHEADDEIGRISEAFNRMAGLLETAEAKRRGAEEGLRMANAELARSNAELDQFAYVASHDLKAPLRGIRSLAGWIGQDLGPQASPEVEENLALLSSRVDRLDRLLDALLAYSRVGRTQAAIDDLGLPGLVAEIAAYLAPPPGFRIEWEGPEQRVRTWRAPLETVLRNLAGNAVKHHDRAEGLVRISADVVDADWLRITVADDGPGIEPAFHEKAFGMFQTLRPRDQVEGSGMGLAIARKTVEHFGGRIEVQSAPPERGCRFVFTWPRDAAADTA